MWRGRDGGDMKQSSSQTGTKDVVVTWYVSYTTKLQ